MGELALQKIGLDLNIINDVLPKSIDLSNLKNFTSFCENLKKYHIANVDISSMKIILDSITEKHPEFQSYIKLFTELNYNHINTTGFQETVMLTDDKIGISNIFKSNNAALIYDQESFISNEYSAHCRLFRIPKSQPIRPSHNFHRFEILNPFLRDAKKIEFIDKYLFKKNNDNSIYERFLNLLIKKVNSLEELVFVFDIEPISQSTLRNWIKSNRTLISNLKIDFKQFNKDPNHDRFIIIDHDKYSIRITTSINNLKYSNSEFKAIKGMEISVRNSRWYEN